MKFFLLLISIIFGGCVQTEVVGGKPDKIKTITVWDSDLKLCYDRLTDDGNSKRRGRGVEGEEIIEEEIPEVWVDLVGINKEVDEVPTDDLDNLVRIEVEKKVKTDEGKSKKNEEVKEREEEPQKEKRAPEKIIWIIVLTALSSFGGYFASMKKKKDRKEKR